MENLPSDFDYNAVRGTDRHPGHRADFFDFKVVDTSGKTSETARVWINVRLTRESNTPPVSNPISLSTVENVPVSGASVRFDSGDAESPNHLRHEILVTAPGVVPAFAAPALGTITPGAPDDPHDPRFVYTPNPFHHGVETLRYYAVDVFGAKAEPAAFEVRVDEVNQAPRGACAADAWMDDDLADAMGRGTEFVVTAAEAGGRVKDLVAFRAQADAGTLRAQFVSFAATLAELEAMAAIAGAEATALACGDEETKICLLYTSPSPRD